MQKIELYQQLAELKAKYPELFEEVAREHPDWFQVIVDEQKELEILSRVRTDSPEGYCAFYEGLHGIKPPWQVVQWVNEIYTAHEQGLGYTLNGYRGSWKSVSISVDFMAWRIGNEPRKTNLIISANDDSADKITKAVSQIIEFHPFWKKAFPSIVPDSGRWSSNGYWVVDNSMPKEEWAKLQAGVIDPTLLGGGYTSTRINGKHPTGVLGIDDIHDLNNSTSDTERKYVVRFVTTVLMKTVIRKNDKLDTWVLNIGVPWATDDTHRVLSTSGAFFASNLPVMKRAKEGDEGAVYIDGVNEQTGVTYDDIKGWWILAWPEKFGVNTIKKERGLGKFDFWQMMMMDLSSAKSGSLKYYIYPKANVDPNWPTAGGVDVPYDFKERHDNQTKLSSFAMAYLSKRPASGAVLVGGVVDHPTMGQAFSHMLAAQSNFTNWIFTFCENVGGGRVFISAARLMFPHLKIMGSDLGKIIRQPGEGAGKARNKKTRIQTELAPWLENGTILISDLDDPYLNLVRDALDNFSELNDARADDRLDVLDAFYHAVKGIPDVLVGQKFDEELPAIFKKEKAPHPLAGRKNR